MYKEKQNKMKIIEEAAMDHVKSANGFVSKDISFKNGVAFAQRWIPVYEELPTAIESGHWDGLRSDFVLAKDSHGEWHKARIYTGFMDGFDFCNWVDERDCELVNIVEWRPVELR